MTNLKLPQHIAVIMDGNGRWAQQQHLPRVVGHQTGVESARNIIKWCGEKGIKTLTLFAFSSENWRRPPSEVNYLMELFLNTLARETKKLYKQGIQLRVIGDHTSLSDTLRARIQEAQMLTKENTGLTVNLAIDYGGRWDIVQASRQIATRVMEVSLSIENIDPEVFSSFLCNADLPEPDLFIRTGGEKRISNFLIWQLAYTELFFTDVLWPDFNQASFEEALVFYASRQRRFGYTGEQIEDLHHV